MTYVKLFIGLLFVGLEISAEELESHECNFSGINLEEETDKLLDMLPKTYRANGPDDLTPLFPGLDVGGVHITGMDKIRRYGPVAPYCSKGTPLAQVDLINLGDVQFISLWRLCSGQNGTVSLSVEHSRFTVHLRVRSRGTGEKYLGVAYKYPMMPVDNYNAKITVEGLGDAGIIASRAFSNLFPSVPLKLWMGNFLGNFRAALHDAVEDRGEMM